MKLPNAERAVVEVAKLRDYCLNEAHPKGGPKARFFLAQGYEAANPAVLEAALRRIAETGTVVNQRATPFGTSYGVVGEVQAPRGITVRLQTVWFVRTGEEQPQFVTAYPASSAFPEPDGNERDRP